MTLPDSSPEPYRSGFVAVIGRPNVGKSRLMNALLRQKIAIVSPRPQTTRQRQLGIVTAPDHQMIFVDTPGLISVPHHKLDEFMLRVANEALADADVVLWLVDGSTPPQPEDEAIARRLAVAVAPGQVILGINKLDLLRPAEVQPRAEAYSRLLPDAPWIMFSAEKAQGLDELYAMLLAALPPGPQYYPEDQVTETYVRHIAADLIREQLLVQLRDEVPHSAAILVQEFKERPNGVTYIRADIVVERDTHKKIVIGKNGQQLRSIGAAARLEIADLLQTEVYLDLWVKVSPNWRGDESLLRQLGYAEAE